MSLEAGKTPKVSIIVPMYNVGQYAIPCLKSLLSQTYSNLEIIVVDDGSTDDTSVICETIIDGDSRVTILHKQNGGLSSARNYGLRNSTGDYVMYVDGDDLLDTWAVEHLVDLAQQTGSKLVTCSYKKVSSAEDFETGIISTYRTVSGLELLRMMLLLDGESGSACAKLYSRDLCPILDFPEGQLFEDFGVESRVFSQIETACVSDAALYGYVTRENSITTVRGYGDAHLAGMEKSLQTVRTVVAGFPMLRVPFSCFEAFCSLRVASRIDLERCTDRSLAIEYINLARNRCRIASRNPQVGRVWRIRCALFAISPSLHNYFYAIYGRLTGKVIA